MSESFLKTREWLRLEYYRNSIRGCKHCKHYQEATFCGFKIWGCDIQMIKPKNEGAADPETTGSSCNKWKESDELVQQIREEIRKEGTYIRGYDE